MDSSLGVSQTDLGTLKNSTLVAQPAIQSQNQLWWRSIRHSDNTHEQHSLSSHGSTHLKTTQPLPLGGAVHSTCMSDLGMDDVWTIAFGQRSLNLVEVSPNKENTPTFRVL